MEQKKRRKHVSGRTIGAAVAALVLVVCAILALLYRDRLTADSLNSSFADDPVPEAAAAPFTYEADAQQVFAVAGDQLAIASSTGLQLLDEDGITVARDVYSMDTPAVSASEAGSVFFDVGGTALRVVQPDGQVTQLDTQQPIISARINDAGWFAVVSEETGYKALVTVYNKDMQPVYAWHAGSSYVLMAEVSPDCTTLAVLGVQTDGGQLTLFSLSSETPLGSYTAPEELFWDMTWMDRDRICLLSESRLAFFDSKGTECGSYSFQEQYLLDYDLKGGNYAALLLGKYRSGGDGLLVTVDADGAELGRSQVLQKTEISLSAGEDTLLLLCSDGLDLMTSTLTPVNRYTETLGVKSALLRQDGKCLLLSSYAAELIHLR